MGMFSKVSLLLLFVLIALFSGAAALKPAIRSIPKFSIPAAATPFLTPVAAMAAEGTGRAFGFDSFPVVLAAIAPTLLIFPLYLKWSSQQDGDDFFDGYEKRRSG